MSRVMKSGIMQ